MELVYLWVEDYKNIKKQGFNFSPRFTCSYDEKTNELTINENKNYINIFPKNINITAIVGENGSGKSSIIETLLLGFYKAKEKPNNNWILVLEGKKLCITEFYENKKFKKIKISNLELMEQSVDTYEGYDYFVKPIKKDIFNLFYNSSTELLSQYFLKFVHKDSSKYYAHIYDIDYNNFNIMNIFSFPSKRNGLIDIKKNENVAILNMFKIKECFSNEELKKILGQAIHNNKIVFIPEKIELTLDIESLENKIIRNKEFVKNIIYNNRKLTLKSLYIYFIILTLQSASEQIPEFKEFFSKKDSDLEKYFEKEYKKITKEVLVNSMEKLIDDFIKQIKDKNLIEKELLIKNIFKNIDDFIELFQDKNLTEKELLIKNIIENIDDFIKQFQDKNLVENLENNKLDIDVQNTANLIDKINSYKNENIDLEQEITKINQIKILLPNLPTYIKLKVIDKEKRNFNDFSMGEKNIISLIFSLIYYIRFFSENHKIINIILDEIELGFHPNWQKSLLVVIINLLKQFQNKKFIVAIASHSPFILSDIPKENVIFLKNGEQVYPDINTFGANIHTLLSHGFFMQDGLMGEFAKSKIDDVIKFLNNDKNSSIQTNDEAQNIINIIGEPIIKRQLQKILDSKKIDSIKNKVNEIDSIKNQIEELNKRLEDLENDKSS